MEAIMPLATTLAGIELEHPLMNAGGTCKNMDGVERFARSTVAAVMVNIMLDERPGNAGDVYWSNGRYSLNSLGLPSLGVDYFKEKLSEMVNTVHGAGKKLIVNVSGFAPWEYAKLVGLADEAGVDGAELNFGCPNIWLGGSQKPILSFNPPAMLDVLWRILDDNVEVPIGAKLSPFSDPGFIETVCGMFTEAHDRGATRVHWLTLSNTFPNGYIIDPATGKPIISGATGLAGVGGGAMKPIALGQIKQFMIAQAIGQLPEHIEFVGVGGISEGQDIKDYMSVSVEGANKVSAVQAATVYFDHHEDPGVYGEIIAQYAELLENQEA
jgi:dihydroorotate dehydrogenase (fumarate)